MFVALDPALPLLRIVNVIRIVSPGDALIEVGVTLGTSRSGAPDDRTVTLAVCVAVSPPGSRAVIVIVALPVATAVIVTDEPDTEARTTLERDDVAA